MGNLYNIIIALCDEAGITAGKMCNDLGISRGIITDLKAGRKKGISVETAKKIAEYFGVSVPFLLEQGDGEYHEPELTPFYCSYLRLCNRKNISPTAAALDMGFNRSMVTRWKGGSIPRAASLQKIADYFHVSIEALMNGSAGQVAEAGDYHNASSAFYDNFLTQCMEHGETPETVARAIGIEPVETVERWGNGKVPEGSILTKLAEHFNIPVEELTNDGYEIGGEMPDIKEYPDISASPFYDNFLNLCAEKGESPSAVARKIGLSPAAATGWKSGAIPYDATIQKLANHFGVPVETLTGEKPSEDDWSTAFRKNLQTELETIDTDAFSGVGEAEADINDLWEIVQGSKPLSLADAVRAAELVNVPLDTLLYGEQEEQEQKESPAVQQNNGAMDEAAQEIIRFLVDGTPAEKLAVVQVIRAMRGGRK